MPTHDLYPETSSDFRFKVAVCNPDGSTEITRLVSKALKPGELGGIPHSITTFNYDKDQVHFTDVVAAFFDNKNKALLIGDFPDSQLAFNLLVFLNMRNELPELTGFHTSMPRIVFDHKCCANHLTDKVTHLPVSEPDALPNYVKKVTWDFRCQIPISPLRMVPPKAPPKTPRDPV